MEPQVQSNSDLHSFLEFLYGGLNGIAYVATKEVTSDLEAIPQWNQQFFHYPEEASRMENVILQKSPEVEVYVAPALFSSPHPVKENFHASNVVWTEFDGNAPEDYDIEPSLRVRSSGESNQHVYWRLTNPCYDVETLEEINRNITYSMGADSSSWDCNQVLRPPATRNHKMGASVSIIANSNTSYDPSIFNVLPTAPAALDTNSWQLGALPNVEDVLLSRPFTPDLVKLLQKSKAEISNGSGQRAKSLVNLAYGCAQMGLSDAEIFVVLRFADDRWEKFKGRTDRNKRLSHIITVARNKYPSDEVVDDDEPFTFAFDFRTFLNTEINIDWVVEPMLMEQGAMLMVGPSGIGKTQVTLNFMIHMALGKDYLHYKIAKPRKVMFLSLEMDHGSLKKFLESMSHGLTEEELALLQENFLVVPHGEPWALNLPIGQENLIPLIEDFEPDGIFVDSIGSAIKGSLSKDEDVQELINFNDRIRKKYGLFTWYIHHMRKSTNGGHQPSTQDDIYGNQYLLNRATSSYGVLRGRDGLIRIRNFKQRLAAVEQDYHLKRDEHLHFTELQTNADNAPVKLEYKKPDSEKGPEQHGKFTL